MTDKFRKQDAPLPSLMELLGERSDEDEATDSSNSVAVFDGTPPVPPERPSYLGPGPSSVRSAPAERRPSSPPPTPGERPPPTPSPATDSGGGEDGRDAFEPNWYRVLAAQAKVREGDGDDEDSDESPPGERDGSQHAGGSGYPRP